MQKKLWTKHYGPKNVLATTPIDGTTDLYIAEISYERRRIMGIIDKNYNEIIPFGDLHHMFGTRTLDKNNVLIDCVGILGDPNICFRDEYGSFLLRRGKDGIFRVEVNSNAFIAHATYNRLYGAYYVEDPEKVYVSCDEAFPIRSFVYDYKKGKMIEEHDLGEHLDIGELESRIYNSSLPYPGKQPQLVKKGNISGSTLYGFK